MNEQTQRRLRELTGDELRELGAQIRNRRGDQGKTQVQVGEAIGHTISMVSRIESGQRHLSPKAFATICDLLDIDPDEMLERAIGPACPYCGAPHYARKVPQMVKQERRLQAVGPDGAATPVHAVVHVHADPETRAESWVEGFEHAMADRLIDPLEWLREQRALAYDEGQRNPGAPNPHR